MVDSLQTHYLNADFDLSLRPRQVQRTHAKLQRQTRELTALAILGADERDAVVTKVPIPDAFLDYLSDCGVAPPRVFTHPESDPSTTLAPFGWNAEAIEFNQRHHHPAKHPSLDCVRAVNAHSFALELERELFPDSAAGALVESVDELDRFLSRAATDSEWIVKSDHGNAGLGNRRLRSTVLTEADRAFVEARLAEDDCLLIEPFRRRQRDWAMIFEVPFSPATLRLHETVCTRDGGMIGALFDPQTSAALLEEKELAGAAEPIARALEAAGYFGPVCLDGFSHGEGANSYNRPLVDLNCRHSLSDGAYRLWQLLAPDRAMYFRFFALGKLGLPGEISAAVTALGDEAYDPGKRSGIMLGTPLRFGEQQPTARPQLPMKLAVLFFADDKPGAYALERRFRERFEARR